MLNNVIGQVDQVSELRCIAKLWHDPASYRACYDRDVPHLLLIVGAAGMG